MTPSTEAINAATGQRTKKCRFCGEEILAAAQKCRFCGEFLSPAARRAAGQQPVGRQTGSIKIPMGEAFVALFFFLPLGIIALIFASQAQAKLRVGDIAGAEASATTARTLAGISLIAGLIFGVLFLLIAKG